jgi:hypothetical protein
MDVQLAGWRAGWKAVLMVEKMGFLKVGCLVYKMDGRLVEMMVGYLVECLADLLVDWKVAS